MPLRAALCDLDGTLVDSVPGLMWCFRQMLGRLDLAQSHDQLLAVCDGLSMRDICRRLAAAAGCAQDEDVIFAQYCDLIAEAYGDVRPLDGAEEILALLLAGDVRLGLVTSAPARCVRGLLDRLAWSGRFAAVVCGDEVSKGKPDPESYQRALRLLEPPSGAVVALEDSRHGADAALAAGCHVMLIQPMTAPAPSLTLDGAPQICRVPSLADAASQLRAALMTMRKPIS